MSEDGWHAQTPDAVSSEFSEDAEGEFHGAVAAYALDDGDLLFASAPGVAAALAALGGLGGPACAQAMLARGARTHVPLVRYPAPGACGALELLARSCTRALIALNSNATADCARFAALDESTPAVYTVRVVLVGSPETPGAPASGTYELALERTVALFFICRHAGWSAAQRAAMTEPLARVALVRALDARAPGGAGEAPVHAYMHGAFGRALAAACESVRATRARDARRSKCLACRAIGAIVTYDIAGAAESRLLACGLCDSLRSAHQTGTQPARRHRTESRARALALVHPYAPATRAAAQAHAAVPPPPHTSTLSLARVAAATRAEADHATHAHAHALALLVDVLGQTRARALACARDAETRAALVAALPPALDLALLLARATSSAELPCA